MEGLIGAIVGAVIALVASVWVQRMQNDQALKQQRAEWDYLRDQEAERFQRETLAELQDRLEELVSAAGVVDNEKLKLYRDATPDQIEANEVPATDRFREYSKQYRDARARVLVLGVRVGDETVRGELDRILDLVDRLVLTAPVQWEMQARAGTVMPDPLIEVTDRKIALNRRIGALLRRLA